mmetsp:Transcript_99546/g.252967  ORF Transcript_99546/g.252967 Transcript_99546/m.252967 type:complete len:276 (+) Transcript_99546:1089-1916(+)
MCSGGASAVALPVASSPTSAPSRSHRPSLKPQDSRGPTGLIPTANPPRSCPSPESLRADVGSDPEAPRTPSGCPKLGRSPQSMADMQDLVLRKASPPSTSKSPCALPVRLRALRLPCRRAAGLWRSAAPFRGEGAGIREPGEAAGLRTAPGSDSERACRKLLHEADRNLLPEELCAPPCSIGRPGGSGGTSPLRSRAIECEGRTPEALRGRGGSGDCLPCHAPCCTACDDGDGGCSRAKGAGDADRLRAAQVATSVSARSSGLRNRPASLATCRL